MSPVMERPLTPSSSPPFFGFGQASQRSEIDEGQSSASLYAGTIMTVRQNIDQVDNGPSNVEWDQMKKCMSTMISQIVNLTNVLSNIRNLPPRFSSIVRTSQSSELPVLDWNSSSTDNHNERIQPGVQPNHTSLKDPGLNQPDNSRTDSYRVTDCDRETNVSDSPENESRDNSVHKEEDTNASSNEGSCLSH